MRETLLVLLLSLSAVAFAGARNCDSFLSCGDCHTQQDCTWCVVDGAGQCFPAEWQVCKAEDRSCKKTTIFARQDSLCRGAALCSGSSMEDFTGGTRLTNSQSPCVQAGINSRGCVLCGSDAQCTPSELEAYTAEACEDITTETLEALWFARCLPLIQASVKVTVLVPVEQLIEAIGETAVAVFNMLEDNVEQDPVTGYLVFNLPNATVDQIMILKDMVVEMIFRATGTHVNPSEITILDVHLQPLAKKRQGGLLDNYALDIAFSLLKDDDPAAYTELANEFADNLQQGVVEGLDPISVSVTPATTPIFPTSSVTATPRPEEKPRDPTSPLNGGAMFGIIFGSTVGLCLIVGGLTYLFYRYRRANRPPFDSARAQ